MKSYCRIQLATAMCLGLGACVVDDEPEQISTTEQARTVKQSLLLQGVAMQGMNMQGMSMLGFKVDSASLSGTPLTNVRVFRGEVIAERDGVTLRGTNLNGAIFQAQVRNLNVNPPATEIATYRVTNIVQEFERHDPTDTGSTYLYTLEQWVDDMASWRPSCSPDEDGRRVAIPLAAIWDERGDRIETTTMFTFGCTTGVIAKCYRWGYRPWVTGYGDLTAMHWACTRAARADYCGNGIPHTKDGTQINLWDTLPSPGPIQRHGFLPPLGMIFEAGWDTGGAVCLSRARWLLRDGGLLAALCPDRLIPIGLGATVCDSVLEVLLTRPDAKLFNEGGLLNLL